MNESKLAINGGDKVIEGFEGKGQPKIGDEALATIRSRVAERQRAVGYDGDFKTWIEKVTPPDLE